MFGHARLDHGFADPIPTRVFLHVLNRLGVTESASRATLTRLTNQHVLTRIRQGRSAAYSLSAVGLDMLTQGRDRILSSRPFDHPNAQWTLLSFSIPETRRDLRHQLRSRLAWAGFGSLRDGLWISPAAIDAHDLLAGLESPDDLLPLIDLFTATPQLPTTITRVISKAFDVSAIQRAHHDFLDRWASVYKSNGEPLPQLTALLAHWISLLRTDPGLPTTQLDDDWPATQSAKTFRRLFSAWNDAAHLQLRQLVSEGSWEQTA
jgi:phenylacetic acid degradation operon negative regulatory protein